MYPNSHKFYDLADLFVNHKLSYYVEIIKNSKYNIFTDSSFMCLAINLEIIHDNNYYVSRHSKAKKYNFFRYGYEKYNRKKFKQLQ